MPEQHVQNTGPNIKFVDGKMLISGEGVTVEVGPVVNPPNLKPVDLDVDTDELVTPDGARTPVGGAPAPGSGGGAVTFNGDSITAAAGTPLESWTQNGLPWVNIYDGPVLVARKAFVGTAHELAVLVNNADPYFTDNPAGNILVNGGKIECAETTMWALEAAAIAGTITLKSGLRLSVIDCAFIRPFGGDGTPLYYATDFVWNNAAKRFDYDFCLIDEREFTYNTAGGTSADLTTLVGPKEFLARRHQLGQIQLTATGGVAGTAAGNNSARVKLNGVTGGAGPFASQNLAVSLTDTLYWDYKKTLRVLGAASQIANSSSVMDNSPGGSVTTQSTTINSVTTNFSFAAYNVQGANASLFTLRRFALRLHTGMTP